MKKRYAALIFCAIGLLLGSVTSEAKKKPSVTAESAFVMDVQSGAILYEKNIDKREYPASITKVMTALVAIENSSLSETVTYSRNAVTNLESGASNIEIQPGEKLSMEDSLYAILLMSANEACNGVAEHVAGSIDNFVAMMNQKAKELGCTGTHFANPHGLQDEKHYTTPYDIYLMLNEAFTYPEFTEITELPSYTVTYTGSDGTEKSTTLTATDHYLTGEATAPKDVTILGGKTGTTEVAGNCLAILTQNAYGKTFVSIVMGADTKELLYQEMNSLLQNINS